MYIILSMFCYCFSPFLFQQNNRHRCVISRSRRIRTISKMLYIFTRTSVTVYGVVHFIVCVHHGRHELQVSLYSMYVHENLTRLRTRHNSHVSFVSRCSIPECDFKSSADVYKPYWLNRTVPFYGDTPAKCTRYKAYNTTKRQCQYYNFNRSSSIKCDEFVFESGGETTIVSAVNRVQT